MNGHMCAGIWNDMLVIRIGTDGWNAIRRRAACQADGPDRPRDEGLGDDRARRRHRGSDLRRYVDMAIMFCAALPPKPGQ